MSRYILRSNGKGWGVWDRDQGKWRVKPTKTGTEAAQLLAKLVDKKGTPPCDSDKAKS